MVGSHVLDCPHAYKFGWGASRLMIDSTVSDDLLPLSFVTCVSSPETLRTNLLASPCLRPGTPHQVIAVEGCASAAHGSSAGFHHAKHELLECEEDTQCDGTAAVR